MPPEPAEKFDLGLGEDALHHMKGYYRQFGDIYRVYSPTLKRYNYVICHPEYVKHVLQTNNRNYVKGAGIDRVKILLGNGIMVSEGEFWRNQRRMIQPSFHREVISGLMELIKSSNRDLISRWEVKSRERQPLNINDEMSAVTLHIVLNAIFSDDLDYLTEKQGDNPFAILTEETERNLQFAMKFRALGKSIQEIVDMRRSQKRVCIDFLSMLMESKSKDTNEPMSDKQLLDEVMTLIVAGHETTASALVWAWYLISQHTAVEEALYREIKDAFGDEDLDFHHLGKLPYTKQVLEETLRLYPPGWLLTRTSLADDQLGAYFVPKGSDIYISPYLVHRNPAYWADPENFDPERFNPEQTQNRPRFAYFPFGGGPRQCIGDYFAMVEMQFHLAMVMSRFRLEMLPGKPVTLEPHINLRSKYPIMMKAILR